MLNTTRIDLMPLTFGDKSPRNKT